MQLRTESYRSKIMRANSLEARDAEKLIRVYGFRFLQMLDGEESEEAKDKLRVERFTLQKRRKLWELTGKEKVLRPSLCRFQNRNVKINRFLHLYNARTQYNCKTDRKNLLLLAANFIIFSKSCSQKSFHELGDLYF